MNCIGRRLERGFAILQMEPDEGGVSLCKPIPIGLVWRTNRDYVPPPKRSNRKPTVRELRIQQGSLAPALYHRWSLLLDVRLSFERLPFIEVRQKAMLIRLADILLMIERFYR